MKQKIFVAIIFLMSMVIFGNSLALAGDKGRHRWEGFAIGVGTVLIGNAILNNMADSQHVSVGVTYGDRDRHHGTYNNHKHDGNRHHGKHDYYDRNRDRQHERYAHQSPRHCRGHKCNGHWEKKRTWKPPVFSKVWISGHYNHRGCWVSGGWRKKLHTPGHWIIEEIWISHR